MRIYGITDRTLERLAELLAFPAFSLGFWALYLFCGLTDMAGRARRPEDRLRQRLRRPAGHGGGRRFPGGGPGEAPAGAGGPRLALGVAGAHRRHQDREPPLGLPPREGPCGGAHGAESPDGDIVLFLLPLTLPWAALRWSAVPVCALAAAAAVQEGRGLRGGTPRIPPAGGNGGKQRGGDDL